MKNDCIFCKMVSDEIPAPRLFEDDHFIAIRDIRPQAPTHLLILPKKHIESLDQAFPEKGDSEIKLVGQLFEIGTRLARTNGLLPGGFRAVINTGREGGQTVFHLHLHVLGGGPLEKSFTL